MTDSTKLLCSQTWVGVGVGGGGEGAACFSTSQACQKPASEATFYLREDCQGKRQAIPGKDSSMGFCPTRGTSQAGLEGPPAPRSVPCHMHPRPLHPPAWCQLGGAPCREGLTHPDMQRHPRSGAILKERLALCTQKHTIEVLDFKVNVSQRKLSSLACLHLCRASSPRLPSDPGK